MEKRIRRAKKSFMDERMLTLNDACKTRSARARIITVTRYWSNHQVDLWRIIERITCGRPGIHGRSITMQHSGAVGYINCKG